MTALAYLSGRLPDGDANGLYALVPDLVADPAAVRVVVALVDCVKVTQLVDAGGTVPTLRIRRVEAISDAGDRADLERLLAREFERRTGQLVLPLDLERDVRAAFDGSDPAAGGDTPAAGDGPPEPDPPPSKPRRRR